MHPLCKYDIFVYFFSVIEMTRHPITFELRYTRSCAICLMKATDSVNLARCHTASMPLALFQNLRSKLTGQLDLCTQHSHGS